MAIDIKTAEKILGMIMKHHSEIASAAFDIKLTADQRTEAIIKADAIRTTAEVIVKAISTSSLVEDVYLSRLKSAVETNYNKIVAGEWFNG